MVSDVLFEAITQIEEYKEKMPEIYVENKHISKKLEAVLKDMKKLQLFLDVYNPNIHMADILWYEIDDKI